MKPHFFISIIIVLNFTSCQTERGTLDNFEIDEASGLAASISNPGKFWTHNDSGDIARLFLIDSVGRFVSQVNLQNVRNRDWEDIATGPGPMSGVNYIFIGDIGDNYNQYEYKNVYRIAEPVITDQSIINVAQVDVITFQYPDQIRDAETLMVDSRTKDLYIVSKREDSVRVYRAPYPQSVADTLVLEKVLTLPITQATGGDISQDGSGILVKNYESVFYWERRMNETIIEALSREAIKVSYAKEPQGEGIAWSRNGSAYFTISERRFLLNRPKLNRYNHYPDAICD